MNTKEPSPCYHHRPQGRTIILLIVALGACIYGALTGQAEAVFIKAAGICMECIGLG